MEKIDLINIAIKELHPEWKGNVCVETETDNIFLKSHEDNIAEQPDIAAISTYIEGAFAERATIKKELAETDAALVSACLARAIEDLLEGTTIFGEVSEIINRRKVLRSTLNSLEGQV